MKPVMVWIHGGAFIQGSNTTDLFGPDYFVTEDVIQVFINYRLGVFGKCYIYKTPFVGIDRRVLFRYVKSIFNITFEHEIKNMVNLFIYLFIKTIRVEVLLYNSKQ